MVPSARSAIGQHERKRRRAPVRGANLNLDDHGNVETVLDAGAALEIYLAQCRQAGHPQPDVIGWTRSIAR